MGSSTTQNSKASFIEGEKTYLSHRGKDTEGITEFFQYHEQFLCKHDVKLTYSDKFFREAFRPMHLMDFRFFNNLLDRFVVWCQAQEKPSADGEVREFDPELVPYKLFIEYFTEDQNHMIQIFDKQSPMRSVFQFGQILIKTVQSKSNLDKSKEEEIHAIVDQVLRESMLNPATMNFMSDDMQNQFLRESIMATMQLEAGKPDGKSTEDQKYVQFVDIFCLRVLSLITCRGKPTEKAKFLANLVNQAKKKPVQWNNPRLKKAVRFILYFSSVVPLKFLSVNEEEDVFNRILSLGKYSQSRRRKRTSVPVHEFDSSYLWGEQQIKQTEKLFDDVFEIFMEEKFLQVIYPTN